MFTVLYRCNRTIERRTNSPLAGSRRRYLEHLAAGGVSPSMIRNATALMYLVVQLLHQGIWLIIAMTSTFAGNLTLPGARVLSRLM